MTMSSNFWIYAGFSIFVLGTLALDLGVFHRKAHVVRAKEAGIWIGVWVTLAFAFALILSVWKGPEQALLFGTGYLVELSLSADNIFVIVMLFAYFSVPARLQHRVLFWGILGALLMRGAFIGMGAYLIQKMNWIMYVFGAFLIFTGIRMANRQDEQFDAERNIVLRTARRFLRVTSQYDGQKFFTRDNGFSAATPLFLVLLLVEFTDLVFAVDSIPAIFAVTTDPLLVFTSNVFAILGLRSLYFLLAGIIHKFIYLKYGLAAILTFVGSKMLIADIYHMPVYISLAFILISLIVTVAASLLFPGKMPKTVIDESQGTTGSIFGSVQPEVSSREECE
jgi:tellurite resistance protein TerC